VVLPGLGLEARPHRRRATRRNLARRMEVFPGLKDWADYARLIETDPAEKDVVRRLVAVTISRFFRNRGFWEFLRERVLPELARSESPAAWSAGCASGEEPYSLAILWRESFPERPLRILATDIGDEVLQRARVGVYPGASLREVPPELRERWLRREGGKDSYRLDEGVRKMVELARHDLQTDAPPQGRFGLILCRNLAFTYFGREERLRVLWKFASVLEQPGYLAIGRKERLPMSATEWLDTGFPGLYRASRPA